MGLVSTIKTHKAKLNKENNNDTSSNMQKPGTSQGHRSITYHFNLIKRRVQKESNRINIYDYKQTKGVNNPNKEKWQNSNY